MGVGPDTVAIVPIVAAAVCPHPPLMIPDLSAGAAAEVEPLRAAASCAIGDLLGASPEKIILVGTGPSAAWLPAPLIGDFGPWGAPVRVALPSAAAVAAPVPVPVPVPLSIAVGAWLLDQRRAQWPAGVEFAAQVLAADDKPDHCAALGAGLAAEPERTGLLIMGDGSARRTEKAPGSLDPRSAGFDALVAAALVAADPAVLAALDADLASQLMVAGRPAWQLLAGAVTGDASRSRPWRGTLYYADAPYGVGYFVASWLP
jgi:hypothetical protein